MRSSTSSNRVNIARSAVAESSSDPDVTEVQISQMQNAQAAANNAAHKAERARNFSPAPSKPQHLGTPPTPATVESTQSAPRNHSSGRHRVYGTFSSGGPRESPGSFMVGSPCIVDHRPMQSPAPYSPAVAMSQDSCQESISMSQVRNVAAAQWLATRACRLHNTATQRGAGTARRAAQRTGFDLTRGSPRARPPGEHVERHVAPVQAQVQHLRDADSAARQQTLAPPWPSPACVVLLPVRTRAHLEADATCGVSSLDPRRPRQVPRLTWPLAVARPICICRSPMYYQNHPAAEGPCGARCLGWERPPERAPCGLDRPRAA